MAEPKKTKQVKRAKRRKRAKVKLLHTNMLRRIAKMTGLFEYQVRDVILAFIRFTLSDLTEGKEVHILSLGKFWLKKLENTTIWNPNIRKMVKVGVRYVPKFTYGPSVVRFIKAEAKKHFEGTGD